MKFTKTTKTAADWVNKIKLGVAVRLPIEAANELIKYMVEFEPQMNFKIKRYSNKITFTL